MLTKTYYEILPSSLMVNSHYDDGTQNTTLVPYSTIKLIKLLPEADKEGDYSISIVLSVEDRAGMGLFEKEESKIIETFKLLCKSYNAWLDRQ